MADYPRPLFSREQVKQAGDALRGDLDYAPGRANDEMTERTASIFKVAHNWRDAHTLPMHRMRHELSGKVRRDGGRGVTAARGKRMTSIRNKLRSSSLPLDCIQDLGGCRAILDTMDDVRRVIAFYEAEAEHRLVKLYDYIGWPKRSGYRSHHLAFEFVPTREEEAEYEGLRIELQIRTRLQHAWATANEAVGLVLKQDLKHSAGDPDWLRLFVLMASGFAEAEGCPVVDGAPDWAKRIAELRELDQRLGAVTELSNLSRALKITEETSTSAQIFLIVYDTVRDTVHVRGYYNSVAAAADYGKPEFNSATVNSVLVQADRIEGLKEAYPNYFLDVRLFTSNLRKAMAGEALDTLWREPPADTEPGPGEEMEKPAKRPPGRYDRHLKEWQRWELS